MKKEYVEYDDLSEPGRQFADIWEELHDPDSIEAKRVRENRERRAKQIRDDNGL